MWHFDARLISSAERFSLGTTVGTNLLVERRGARTGLLATAGHGDSILIMRGTGRTAGLEPDLHFHPQATDKPAPLVPGALIREIDERVDYQGHELVPLDEAAVEEAVRSLVEDAGSGRSRSPFSSPSRTRLMSSEPWRSSVGQRPTSMSLARTRSRLAWASTSARWLPSSIATWLQPPRPASARPPSACESPA